jgi:16S rRNA (guanine(966)-N(2))-methyltransferase RsmD
MIRITSGTAKGKRLELPNGKKVTAVKEVVKLAIFSIIGAKIENSCCLDVYAGSGNLGIEAISRGAAFCDLVDESKYAIETIEKNLAKCGLSDRAGAIWDDGLKFLANSESMYDIIFADPYYTETNHRHLIKLAMERLNPKGVFFLLTSAGNLNIELPKELVDSTQVEARRYGRTMLSILTSRQKSS